MSQKRRFASALALALTLVLIGAATSIWVTRSNATTASAAEPLLRIQVQSAKASDTYDVARSFVGRIEAARESELGFELAGLLNRIWVEEGDSVTRGERLARLDTERLSARRDELAAAREQAKAQLELARSTDARVTEAAELNAVSTQEWDEARQGLQTRTAAVQQLEAQIRTVEIEIEKSTLYAPYAGVISARRVDEGEVLQVGRPVVRLLEAGRLEARVGISTVEAAEIAVGDALQVVVRGQQLAGRVKAILPEREASTRTVTVLLELPDTAQARSGDLAEIKLTRSVTATGFWLPTSALTESVRGLWSCYVAEPPRDAEGNPGVAHRVTRRDVEVLHATTNQVFVRGTLQPGEQVITDGVHRVVLGQPVLLAESAESGSSS